MEIRLMRFDFYIGRELVARRPVAAAILEPGERVSGGVRRAAEAYCEAHGAGDVFAWVRSIPSGAEEYAEVAFEGGTAMLLQAEWVPHGWVVAGRGGGAIVPPVDVGVEMPWCQIVG